MDGSSDDFLGRVIGQYRIESELGLGGMGQVFLAQDLHLDRKVAIKRLAPELRGDPGFHGHLLAEALHAVRAANMRIAHVLHHLEEDGAEYLVMDYVSGRMLRDEMHHPFDLERFFRVAIQCTEALLAVHRSNYVHCDVKPENFIVEPKGTVRLLDLGIAHEEKADGDLSATTVPLSTAPLLSGSTGTPSYLPPEVLRGHTPDFRSDLFALGTMFHEMLSGRHPFHGANVGAVTKRILEDEPDPIPERSPKLPADLQRLVARCLAKNPAERPQSAQDVLRALMQIQKPGPTTLASWARPAVRIGAGVVLAGALASVVFLFVHERQTPLPADRLVAIETFTGADEAFGVQAAGLSWSVFEVLRRCTNPQALVGAGDRGRAFVPLQAAFLDDPKLGNLVLRGTLSPHGRQTRVALTLSEPESELPLRRHELEIEPADGIASLRHVTQAAAHLLDLDLSPAEVDALLRIATRNGAAMTLDLEGLGLLALYEDPALWRQRGPADSSDAARVALLDRAETAFTQATALDSLDAGAWTGVARVQWQRPGGDRAAALERAARNCQRALGIDLEHAGAHSLLGEVYAATPGRTLAAVPELERALELDPTRNSALRRLAIQYRKLDRPQDVDSLFQGAVALRPRHPYVLNLYGQYCFGVARYDDAAGLFQRSVLLAPREPFGFKSLGAVYIVQGRYENAIPHLEKSLTLQPDRDAFDRLGTAYFMMRRFAAAESTYRRAVDFDSKDALLWGNLGDAYYWNPAQRARAREPYRTAERLAEQALAQDANNPILLGRSAHYKSQEGDRWGARRTLDRALRLAPGNHELRYKDALYYVRYLETDSAFAALAKALEAGYSPIWVHDTPELDALRGDARFSELVPR